MIQLRKTTLNVHCGKILLKALITFLNILKMVVFLHGHILQQYSLKFDVCKYLIELRHASLEPILEGHNLLFIFAI